jgi:protein-tyrosine-phosphatase
MAEALFESLLRSKKLTGAWTVASAGTWAQDGNPASENGRELMKTWHLDLSEHRSRIVRPEMLEAADLILTMEENHKEALLAEFDSLAGRVFMLSEMIGRVHDIRDPYGESMQEYRDTAREIAEYLDKGYPKILELVERPRDPLGRGASG